MKNKKLLLKISGGILSTTLAVVLTVAFLFPNFKVSAVGNVSANSFYTNQPSSVSIPVDQPESNNQLAVFKKNETGQYDLVQKYEITDSKATVTQLNFSKSGENIDLYIAVVPDSKNLDGYNGKIGDTQTTNGTDTVTLSDNGNQLVLKKISVFYDNEAPTISDASLMQASDRGENSWIIGSDKITVKFKISDLGGSHVDTTKIKATLGGKSPVGVVTHNMQTDFYSAEFNVSDFTGSKANGDVLFANTALTVDASDQAGNAAVQYSKALSSDLKYDNFSITAESFCSDNTNKQHAIVGNTLTLKLKTSVAVAEKEDLTVKIGNQVPTTLTNDSTDKTIWTATYKIAADFGLADGRPIPFSIKASNNGNSKTVVNDEKNEATKVTYSNPLNVQEFTFTSSSLLSNAATTGDQLKLTFQTQRKVNQPNVSIAGHPVTPTSNDGGFHWTAEYTLTDKETLSDSDPIPFTMEAEDEFGNTVTKTQADTAEITYFTPVDKTKINLTVTSSSNSTIAKKEDTITVKFSKKMSHYSQIPVEIAGVAVSAQSIDHTNWSASYKLGTNQNEVLSDNGKIACSFSLYVTPLEDNSITYYAPINLSQLEMKSGNDNPALAKNGDTVTASFQTGHPVTLSDTKIAGQAVSFTSTDNDGMHWTGTYTMKDKDIADNATVPLAVTASDTAGNDAVTKTNADLAPDKCVAYFAPISSGFQDLKIVSNNPKPSVAKDSDKVTVSFRTTHPVSVKSSSIAGKGVQFTSSDEMTWQGTYTLKNGDVPDLSNIPFAFTLDDATKNEEVSKSQAELGLKQVQYYAPIAITNLKLVSNEANPYYSKIGSNLTLSLTAQHEVKMESINIAGKVTVPQSADNKNWKAVYQLLKDDIKTDNVNVPFQFAISDEAGNTASQSESNTDSVKYYAPIGINGLSYASNNKQPEYAKDGDTISIHFTTTHPVFLSNQTIAGQKAAFTSTNNDGMNWVASYTVLNGKTKDNTDIPFTFTANDNSGNTATNKTNADVSDHKVVRYFAPIEQSIANCRFASNNKKSGAVYTKNGDTVTLSFATTHPVSLSQTQIAGKPVSFTDVDGSHMNWTASYTISSGELPDNSDVQYALSINDIAQNKQITKTQNDSVKVRYQAPIAISNLTFESNNDKTAKVTARNGNVVTAKFSTAHPVILSNTKIAGQNAVFSSANNNGMDWTAQYTVVNGQTADNSNISLSFTADDASGNTSVTKTEADTARVRYFEPIRVSELKIITDNANNGNQYAKDGNTVTVSFKTNHRMSLSNLSIARHSNVRVQEANVSSNTYRYVLSYQLNNGNLPDLANVDFRFDVDDVAGNSTVRKTDSDVTNRIQYFSPIMAKTTMASNGSDKTFAKNGNTVTLHCEMNHSARIASSEIFGRTASVSGNNSRSLQISYQIPIGESGIKEGGAPFNLSITDLAGNVLPVTTTSDASKVTYDRTDPVVTLTPDFSGFSNKGLTYSVHYSDTNLGGQGLSLTVNGEEQFTAADRNSAAASTSFTKTIQLDAEGEYRISGKAVDRAGNPSTSAVTAKIIIDKTNPKITSAKIDLEKAETFKKGFCIADYFNIKEAYVKTVICRVTDNTGSVDWDINKPIETDGKKTIYLLVTDMAGNNSQALTYDLYIDGTAPKVIVKDLVSSRELVAGKNGAPFVAKESLQISLDKLEMGNEAADQFTKLLLVDRNGKIVQDLLKNGKKVNGKYLLEVPSFGKYKLLVQATDAVGNQTTAEYPFVFEDKSLAAKYYENKPLFYGSVSGLGVLFLGGGGTFLFKFKKRKI